MRTEEFVMRGNTASGATEVLNFSGFKPGYAYKLIDFKVMPSSNLGGLDNECFGTITAGKSAVDPVNPNFNDDGLIGTALMLLRAGDNNFIGPFVDSIINDTFLITQNLILQVVNTGGAGDPVNWQCRFESVKMSGPEEAVANYRQYLISDE